VAETDDVADTRFFDVFTRWVDCQFHSTLLDLTDEPLMEAEI
jgi:hypothetical protein